MFFAGRLPKPPWETRGRVEALVKQYDRAHIQNFGDRFRFQSLQSRFSDLRRSLGPRPARARRRAAGPVPVSASGPAGRPKRRRTGSFASRRFRIRCARWIGCRSSTSRSSRRGARAVEDAVPFHRFAELVKSQVSQLRSSGSSRGGVPGDGEGREGQLYGPRRSKGGQEEAGVWRAGQPEGRPAARVC